MRLGLGMGLKNLRSSGPSGLNPDHVKLLLHFDSDFSDSSANNKAPSFPGAPTPAIDTTKKVFGGGSYKGEGNNRVKYPASTDWNVGGLTPWQMSWRMYLTSTTQNSWLFSTTTVYNGSGWIFMVNGSLWRFKCFYGLVLCLSHLCLASVPNEP